MSHNWLPGYREPGTNGVRGWLCQRSLISGTEGKRNIRDQARFKGTGINKHSEKARSLLRLQTLRKSSPPLKLSYLFPKGAVFLADIPDNTCISLLAWLLDVLSQMSFLSCFSSVFVAAQWTKLYSLTSPSHGCEVMSAMSSPTL